MTLLPLSCVLNGCASLAEPREGSQDVPLEPDPKTFCPIVLLLSPASAPVWMCGTGMLAGQVAVGCASFAEGEGRKERDCDKYGGVPQSGTRDRRVEAKIPRRR